VSEQSRYDLRLADSLKPGGLDALPDKSVDVAISDPPYSEHTHKKQRRGSSLPDTSGERWRGESRGGAACFNRARHLGFDHITSAEMKIAAEQYARLVRRWVLVFTDNENVGQWLAALMAAGLEHVRVGCWVKLGCTPQFTGDRPASGHESIVIAHPKGRKRWNGGGSHAVWTHPIVLERGAGGEPRVHTTQKPLALMLDLVRAFSEPGELVLDSHAGSGTTGVACLLSGRRFLGFERKPDIHPVGLARLNAATEQRIDVDVEQIGLFAAGSS
jgi:hypothetical protein